MKLDPVHRDICGEYKGWNAHRRHNENQCDPCKKAAADYARDRRHKIGESKSSLYTHAQIEDIRKTAILDSHRTTLTRRASRIKYGKRVPA